MKEIAKKVIFAVLCLLVFWFFGVITMKIFDWILRLDIENIIYEGFQVGFIAWILIGILLIFTKKRKKL